MAATGSTERKRREIASNEKSCFNLFPGLSRERFGTNAEGAKMIPPCEAAPATAATHMAASTGAVMVSNRVPVQLSSGVDSSPRVALSTSTRSNKPRHAAGNSLALHPRHNTAPTNARLLVRSRLRAIWPFSRACFCRRGVAFSVLFSPANFSASLFALSRQMQEMFRSRNRQAELALKQSRPTAGRQHHHRQTQKAFHRKPRQSWGKLGPGFPHEAQRHTHQQVCPHSRGRHLQPRQPQSPRRLQRSH